MEKIKIKEAIVAEGKYDKVKLGNIFDTAVFTTNGFDIYKNKKNLEMIKRVAEKQGLIILTDSDSAGFRIRTYLKQCLGDISVKNVYVPEIKGKEKRKNSFSKEGLLGVEGIDDKIIIDAVMSQAQRETNKCENEKITKTDLYEYGLLGGKESSKKRIKLLKKANLPVKMSSNRLLEVLNILYDRQEFEEMLKDTD